MLTDRVKLRITPCGHKLARVRVEGVSRPGQDTMLDHSPPRRATLASPTSQPSEWKTRQLVQQVSSPNLTRAAWSWLWRIWKASFLVSPRTFRGIKRAMSRPLCSRASATSGPGASDVAVPGEERVGGGSGPSPGLHVGSHQHISSAQTCNRDGSIDRPFSSQTNNAEQHSTQVRCETDTRVFSLTRIASQQRWRIDDIPRTPSSSLLTTWNGHLSLSDEETAGERHRPT